MARDRQEPLTDAEIEALREQMDEQWSDVREYLESEGVEISDRRDRSADEARADGGDS